MMELGPLYACRICLTNNTKLFHIDTFQIKSHYEEVLHCTLPETDNLLKYICYQCRALLEKYHSFRERCVKSQDILKHVMRQKWKVPIEHVLKVEQAKHKIQPPINAMIPTERLGVYQFKGDGIKSYHAREVSDEDVTEKVDEPNDKTLRFAKSDPTVIKDVSEFLQFKPKINNLNEPRKEPEDVAFDLNDSSDEPETTETALPKNSLSIPKKKYAKQNSLDRKMWNIFTLSVEETCKEYLAKIEQQSKTYKFHCMVCSRGFTSQNTVDRHMILHSEDRGPHVCVLCKKRFKWPPKLRVHMKLHQIRYRCQSCGDIFLTSYEARVHERIHIGIKYTCTHCDAKFIKRSKYYSHLRLVHRRSTHLCSKCGLSFVSHIELNKHISKIHKVEGAEATTHCGKCDITFETLQEYEEHKSTSAMHDDDDDYDAEESEDKSKNVAPPVCSECNMKFASKPGLARHRFYIHKADAQPSARNRKERIICEVCGKSLASSSAAQHMNRHTRAVQYPCPTCGKVFYAQENRIRHMRIHTGERPHPCRLCDKRFGERSNLLQHIKGCHMKLPYPTNPKRRKNLPKFADLGI